MHADYVPNPLYDNNPFIEALPPMLSGKDLIRALAVIPPYSDSDRDRSTGERLQLLSSLYEFYQPLSMTIDLYCEIYTAMQHCYGQYSIQSEAAAMQNGYSLMHGNALAASVGGGNSFSVIGVSGLGKSTALQRVLSLFPQVIEHTSYHGQNFYCHQIPYLVVQTPHDASIKALILDIYLQIDSLVGTSYQKDALSRRLSIDVLVSQLNQIVRVNHIGLLVIDELQNIAYRKSDGGIRFLNFLVHLINGAGVSICMVGTPRVLQVLQQEFRSARRTTGLVYDRLPNDKEFALLLHGLWHYQYTQYATDLTPELANWLYRKTQGIPDILAKLLYNAQKQAILDGREKLDLEVFESAFLRNLGMVSEYISELSTKSVAKRQTKTAPEVSVGSAAPTKIVGNDIRMLLKKAKKSGELPVYVINNSLLLFSSPKYFMDCVKSILSLCSFISSNNNLYPYIFCNNFSYSQINNAIFSPSSLGNINRLSIASFFSSSIFVKNSLRARLEFGLCIASIHTSKLELFVSHPHSLSMANSGSSFLVLSSITLFSL